MKYDTFDSLMGQICLSQEKLSSKAKEILKLITVLRSQKPVNTEKKIMHNGTVPSCVLSKFKKLQSLLPKEVADKLRQVNERLRRPPRERVISVE